ncbi:MAG: hypothetical protein JSV04_10885 [Candidatus Heimdallarchaeota archaeon]|nr:MAG: hypothetical protein JSV04_10885 [Candidatus Heimdallarchaeota archaeon]
MKTDHNQRLGFGRYSKTAHGREGPHRTRRKDRRISEITVTTAKSQLMSTGEIIEVLAVIGGGKEATVLLAKNHEDELVCAKVFRFFTSTIKKRLRGTIHITASDMANLVAKQEYWNLYEMQKFVNVPKPRLLVDNIVIMDFIPEEEGSTKPAPLLREVDLGNFDPEELFYESIDLLAELFLKGYFIHGDYSEHNLMLTREGFLITMDVSQSVQYNTKTFITTPIRIRIDNAVELLRTDIENINQFFKRIYRIAIESEEVIEEIINELPLKLRNFLFQRTMEIYPSELYSPEIMVGKEKWRDEIIYHRTGTRRQQPK